MKGHCVCILADGTTSDQLGIACLHLLLWVSRALYVAWAGAAWRCCWLRDNCSRMQELVQDGEVSKDAVVFTQSVLDLRRKYATIVAEAFNGDRLFLQAVNHAFEVCPQWP